jgi:hypothetical protein
MNDIYKSILFSLQKIGIYQTSAERSWLGTKTCGIQKRYQVRTSNGN